MRLSTVNNYLEVLKPRATALLTFVGVAAAVIAGDGYPPPGSLLLILVTLLILSGGVNGLTNYLDRDIDAKIQRTRHRALPSKRIYPPQKVLPLTLGLTTFGLILTWLLHPLSMLAGLVGTIAAVVWRKRATCVFPQGILASCAPALIGWFAIKPAFSWEILLLCSLVAVWLPLHVWSIMIANREDYINAGQTYFPMSKEANESTKTLLSLSLVLSTIAVTLYFIADFSPFYLIMASLLSILIIFSSARLTASRTSHNAWRLYKLTAFPYLGFILVAMSLDVRLF